MKRRNRRKKWKETLWIEKVHPIKRSLHSKVINKRNNSNTSNQRKKTPKKVNDKKTNERNNSKSDDLGEVNNITFKFNNNNKDASIFDSICGNE
jgi:hypothetical protein